MLFLLSPLNPAVKMFKLLSLVLLLKCFDTYRLPHFAFVKFCLYDYHLSVLFQPIFLALTR